MIKELIEIRKELSVGVKVEDLLYIKMQINKLDTLIFEASKNNVVLPDVRSLLSHDDAKFIYSLLPKWTKIKAPEGLDPTFYGTLSKKGDDEIQDRVNKILGNKLLTS